MLRRLTFADWAAGLAGALGLLAAFLPWYSYGSGSARITVNGFRASLLGDIFFLGIAAAGLLMLVRHDVIDDPATLKQRERTVLSAITAVLGLALLLQLILIAIGGRHCGDRFWRQRAGAVSGATVRPCRLCDD